MNHAKWHRRFRLSLIMGLAFLMAFPVVAAEESATVNSSTIEEAAVPAILSANIYESGLRLSKELSLFDQDFGGLLDFTVVDLGNDGTDEIVVAKGYDDAPMIQIYRMDGSLINEWQPYVASYDGRIAVAAGDLNGDGKEDIISGTGEGGGPHIKMFDGFGAEPFGEGFFADSAEYLDGTEIAVGDVTGDGELNIAVSLKRSKTNVVRFFNYHGEEVLPAMEFDIDQTVSPLPIYLYDVDGDGLSEVLVSSGIGNDPELKILKTDGEVVRSFMVYPEAFRGGFDIAAGEMDGRQVIVTSAGFGGGPHVRFFDLEGNPVIHPAFFPYENDFKGGVNIEIAQSRGQTRLVTVPLTTSAEISSNLFEKQIVVDLSEQRLYAYSRGRVDNTFLISSGLNRFPTPLGEFEIYRKRPITRMAWTYGPGDPNNYDLPGVKYAMSFVGPYNLHGAYWHNNFGHQMSHGCVNISDTNAEWLYEWSPMGTKVKIQK